MHNPWYRSALCYISFLPSVALGYNNPIDAAPTDNTDVAYRIASNTSDTSEASILNFMKYSTNFKFIMSIVLSESCGT